MVESFGVGRAQQLSPPQRSRRIALRPIVPADYDFLYHLALANEVGFRWRARGSTPSPEGFVQAVWNQVLVQFLVEDRRTGQPIGHVVAFDASFVNDHVQVGLVGLPELMYSGRLIEAACLFFNYLFTIWNFRKLYAESIEFNYESFRSGAGRFFREEGILREHEFHAGRYWDVYVLSIWREDLRTVAERYLPRIGAE